MRPGAALAILVLALGCSDESNLVPLDWSLNRMVDQPKYTDFKASKGFANGRVMQPPPAGTVSRERLVGPLPLTLGIQENGDYTDSYPFPMTAELIEMGRNRFDRTCGACHGILGNGESEVAFKMKLVKPPSLHAPFIRDYPLGRLYQIATFGYGIMPGYDYLLDDTERWAVIAYVKALQLSQQATLDELPPDVARPFRSEVP